MSDNIIHEYTHKAVCPHCGYECEDSWEINDGEDGYAGVYECGRCEKNYHVTRHLTVKYSTEVPSE